MKPQLPVNVTVKRLSGRGVAGEVGVGGRAVKVEVGGAAVVAGGGAGGAAQAANAQTSAR